MKSNLKALFLIMISAFTIATAQMPAMEALRGLKRANEKFVNNTTFKAQRKGLENGQNPGYVVLGCADSRATPEYLFDQPLGNMFTVRTAGQVIDDVVIDTLEFAIKTFDVVNLIVLGHQNCGAVDGALDRLRDNNGKIIKKPTNTGGYSRLDAVLIPIEQAILAQKVDINAEDALEKATVANVRHIMNQLAERSSIIKKAIKDKKIIVVGGVYNLETGNVEIL